jgi:hypothetical protein
VPCDKIAIERVLSRLYEAKVEHLKAGQQWFQLRYFVAMKCRFFQGLQSSSKCDAKCDATLIAHDSDATRLQILKKRLGWREDSPAEQKEVKNTGASLLFWAAFADDLPSARQLLRVGCGPDLHRGLKKNIPQFTLVAKMNSLMMAMMFGRWAIVELLLKAGASPLVRDGEEKDALMWASLIGNEANVASWLKMFPDWNLERRDSTVGMTALHWSAAIGANKKSTIKILLQRGADPLMYSSNGMTFLNYVVANPDLSGDVVQWILDYKDGIIRPLLHCGSCPQTLMWRATSSATRALCFFGVKSKMVKELAAWEGSTPLHYAARYGHYSLVALLVAAGAPVGAQTAQGLSPLQLTRQSHGGIAPRVFEKAMSMDPLYRKSPSEATVKRSL